MYYLVNRHTIAIGEILMKRISLFLVIIILLSLSACTLQMPGVEPSPSPISTTEISELTDSIPTNTDVATEQPAITEPSQPPTSAPPAAAQRTPYPEPATQAPPSPTSQPTATQPAPTASPTPVTTFDPYKEYGKPKYQNRMEFPNLGEWAQAETDELPNNSRIRLEFEDGELNVTGKRPDFSTWWFSYHTLKDAFIEMTFDSEDCSSGDAYGIILRGPPHLAGESYGYAVAFTCDGSLWVLRLDGVDPWDAETLVEEDDISAINTGSYEQNVIGVQAEDDQFIVFANGVRVAEVEDDEFAKGRVGVFVRSAWPGPYTYRVTNFAYWILGVDE